VSVRLIWRLSNLELLQIGNRVKFARFTVYSSWTWALGVKSIWSFFLQINRQVESGAPLVRPSDCPPRPHRPYRRWYYCRSCRPYATSSSWSLLSPFGSDHTGIWWGTSWMTQLLYSRHRGSTIWRGTF